ncbi:MAG TPA: PRC-barrel domain-containing protein [Gemmatimonadales bacterium]|nr:PRC-barrel domain-containing protein [Gemmatimonadales bacterium]
MRTETRSGALHRLKDSDLKLEDPRADIRGRTVKDSGGEEIGKVHDLLVDERERKVRFLEVASGGVLGIGQTKILLPVETVTRIEDEVVWTNQTRETLRGAPRYDPELVEQPYLGELYDYYGYRTPFWDAAYVYPRYPYL